MDPANEQLKLLLNSCVLAQSLKFYLTYSAVLAAHSNLPAKVVALHNA